MIIGALSSGGRPDDSHTALLITAEDRQEYAVGALPDRVRVAPVSFAIVKDPRELLVRRIRVDDDPRDAEEPATSITTAYGRRYPAAALVLAAIAAVLIADPASAGPTTGQVSVRASTPALPPAPPWGACGRSTAEDKVVRQFPNGITLRCGGPLRGPAPRYGYRHIQFRHQQDFQNMALEPGVFRNWRDVADFATETIAADPDVTKPAPGGQTCLSRIIFLANEQTGQVVRQQIVVMFIGDGTRDINTLTPREGQC